MSDTLYPLLFQPVYKDNIWGGTRIPTLYHRQAPPGPCAESWEIADRPEGMSIVTNGPLAGTSLRELMASRGRDVVGTAGSAGRFPLLIKILDARERLSVQVHPDDETSARYGGEPKTEMWYVLAADEGAQLFAGLTPGTTPQVFTKAATAGTVEALLGSIPARPGTAVYMPGGLVHAIGEGCLLLEIQQNSDTTYRVYDWKRVGKDGRPRDTHLRQALEVINWNLATPAAIEPGQAAESNGNTTWDVLKSPYFRVTRLDLARPDTIAADHRTFQVVFVSGGSVEIVGNDVAVRCATGSTCLVPAAMPAWTVRPLDGRASVIRIGLV